MHCAIVDKLWQCILHFCILPALHSAFFDQHLISSQVGPQQSDPIGLSFFVRELNNDNYGLRPSKPGDTGKYQIDYILTKCRYWHSVCNAKAYPGANIDSDHNLVVLD